MRELVRAHAHGARRAQLPAPWVRRFEHAHKGQGPDWRDLGERQEAPPKHSARGGRHEHEVACSVAGRGRLSNDAGDCRTRCGLVRAGDAQASSPRGSTLPHRPTSRACNACPLRPAYRASCRGHSHPSTPSLRNPASHQESPHVRRSRTRRTRQIPYVRAGARKRPSRRR